MYKTTNKKLIIELVELLAIKQVTNVVISPGSRNAPLIIALANHPEIKSFVVVDERSAAFFALGMAQILNTPVAIVSTSGSAALNYAPAISEAYYQQIPLIVITADRPTEWINQGEGQAIDQVQIYRNFIKSSFNLPLDVFSNDELWYANRTINQAINDSITKPNGPVHINAPLREPIYNTEMIQEYRPRVFQYVIPDSKLPEYQISDLRTILSSNKKILILAGMLPQNIVLNNLLIELTKKNVVVLTETISNLHSERFFGVIDRNITITDNNDFEMQLIPDVLITIGHSVVSKRIKALLRKTKIAHHWNVGYTYSAQDTYQALTLDFQLMETVFLQQLLNIDFNGDEHYYNRWQNLHNFRKQKHHQFLQNCEWSDFLAYNTIFNNLPSKSHIHLGNSTPARYAQLFDYPENYTWLSNRGTSGIDGSTSTAVGYAIKNEQFTILISGDLSFYYDANALWNNYLNRKLRIIVFNNQGGNIFRYIPGPDSTTELDMYFEAVQSGRTAGHLANMYQIPYFSAHNQTELNSVIKSFFELSEKPAILEIFTPRLIDATVLREYFKFLNK